MILAIMNAIYAIAYIEAWKIQDFNGIETKRIELWFRLCIKAWDVDKTLKSWTKL